MTANEKTWTETHRSYLLAVTWPPALILGLVSAMLLATVDYRATIIADLGIIGCWIVLVSKGLEAVEYQFALGRLYELDQVLRQLFAIESSQRRDSLDSYMSWRANYFTTYGDLVIVMQHIRRHKELPGVTKVEMLVGKAVELSTEAVRAAA
jgi:hypothetical protein